MTKGAARRLLIQCSCRCNTRAGEGRTLNWGYCAQISSLPALSPCKSFQDQNISFSGGREWVALGIGAGLPVLAEGEDEEAKLWSLCRSKSDSL